MIDAPTDVTAIPRIGHHEAMRITAVEQRKFGEQLRTFDADDWGKPTACALWDVRAVAAHLIGSAAAQRSPVEFVRQVRKGRPLVAEIGSRFWWDGMNELQVRERAARTTAELLDEWDVNAARALRARTRLPRLIARLPLLNLPQPVGRQPVAYLFDIGFTRDIWAHRIDLAVATGRPFDADPDHDGRILADLVAEWATTHDEPFTLDLEGPAGGRFQRGTGGQTVGMDAIEFVRVLAERVEAGGVLRHKLPL